MTLRTTLRLVLLGGAVWAVPDAAGAQVNDVYACVNNSASRRANYRRRR